MGLDQLKSVHSKQLTQVRRLLEARTNIQLLQFQHHEVIENPLIAAAGRGRCSAAVLAVTYWQAKSRDDTDHRRQIVDFAWRRRCWVTYVSPHWLHIRFPSGLRPKERHSPPGRGCDLERNESPILLRVTGYYSFIH